MSNKPTNLIDNIINKKAFVNRRTFISSTTSMALASQIPKAVFGQVKQLVALVHTQAAGDNGPIDSMIAQLRKLGKDHNVQIRNIYASDPAAYETIFRNLGEAGAAIIVTTFHEMAAPIKAVAPKFPKTKFVHLFSDPLNPPISNVRTISYDYYLGCYLSGYFGALMSKTGKLGFVGGTSEPTINSDANAAKAGALAARPDSTFKIAFAGSWQDPAKGKEIARQMFADGIDYIILDSGGTDIGVINEANVKAGRMVSGVAPSQYTVGPQSVAAIVKLDFGASLYKESVNILSNKWQSGHHAEKLGDIMDFVQSPVFSSKGPADLIDKLKNVMPKVFDVKNKIINGTIKIPRNPQL